MNTTNESAAKTKKGPHAAGWYWFPTDLGRRPHVWELRDADDNVILETTGIELVAKDKYTALIREAPALLQALCGIIDAADADALDTDDIESARALVAKIPRAAA